MKSLFKVGNTELGTFEVLSDSAGNVSINRSSALKSRTASVTLVAADLGNTQVLNAAAGLTVTLPAATGTGAKVEVIVGTTVTSNSAIIVCAGTDEFAGTIYSVDTDTTDTLVAYPAVAADNYDTITMDGSTTGGLQGDKFILTDIATGVWALEGHVRCTGVQATPLSAA